MYADIIEAKIPDIYKIYKIYGSCNIPFTNSDTIRCIDEEDATLINQLIYTCSQYSIFELIEIIRKQSPWKDAYKPASENVITNEAIKAFFMENS